MSGGSYDYAYCKVNNFIDDLERRANTPERRAFIKHLVLVSEAMKAIEWVDGGDCGHPHDSDAIFKVLMNTANQSKM